MSDADRVTVIGRGRVGRALHAAFEASEGIRHSRLLAGRAPARRTAPGTVLVLAVPDGSIAEVGSRWATAMGAEGVLLHCAGAKGIEAFGALAAQGTRAGLGTMHPLASFADPRRAPSLRGVAFALAGEEDALVAARRLVAAVGGVGLVGAGGRPLPGAAYHAAAAMVANGAAALADAGARIFEELGADPAQASEALGHLLATVAKNVVDLGTPEALSGPIRRGDAETVARHRAALSGRSLRAYDAIAPLILTTAEGLGLAPAAAERVRDALASEATGRAPEGPALDADTNLDTDSAEIA